MSENTSKIGKPEISFTLNKDPDKLSVTENSSPCEPWTVNIGVEEPDPITVNLLVPDPEMRAVDEVTAKIVFTDPVIVTFWLSGFT